MNLPSKIISITGYISSISVAYELDIEDSEFPIESPRSAKFKAALSLAPSPTKATV